MSQRGVDPLVGDVDPYAVETSVEVVEPELLPSAQPSVTTRARASVDRAVTQARAGVREGVGKVAQSTQRNPIGTALGALSVGFVAGLLIPSSQAEQDKLAPVADGIRDTVATGTETVAEVKEGAVARAKQVEREQTGA